MENSNRYSERRAARIERLGMLYKRWLSPPLHALGGTLLPMRGGCRYLPTCSEYAAVAIARHGWARGTALAAGRLLRCHPWSRGGFDPVPDRPSRPRQSEPAQRL